MTERFYVGNESECQTLRGALDALHGLPSPPSTGEHVCTPEERAEKTAAWLGLTQNQRDSKSYDASWPEWSLRYTDLVYETEPGTRLGIWIPDDLQSLMASATAAGVVLSYEQTLALLAAIAASLESKPSDWVEPVGEV